MYREVAAYLEKWKMILPGESVCVGFSGGADSTALLLCLWEYGKTHGNRVYALHVNHGIRGEEADRDQRFCEEFCAERGIGLRVCAADVPELARAEQIGEEEAGRKARYRAFEEELKSGRASRIALAHHQNDQAETVLFHLMRGSGLKGLRGMEPIRGNYIRPLLCVERGEIEGWLKERGIIWAEDRTNQELVYTRNRIRHQVIAPMEEILPGSVRRMAGAAERLLGIEDYLDAECERLAAECVRWGEDGCEIGLPYFGKLHPAMQKLLALHILERLLGSRRDLAEAHAEALAGLVRSGRGSSVRLPGGLVAVLDYESIRIRRGYGNLKPPEPLACTSDGAYEFAGERFLFSLKDREKLGEIPRNRYTKWFDYDKIQSILMLRTRLPGDFLELKGGIRKKLKKYLIDEKVPRDLRSGCILLADGSHIVWVVGLRISERYKVTEETRRVLVVQKTEET